MLELGGIAQAAPVNQVGFRVLVEPKKSAD